MVMMFTSRSLERESERESLISHTKTHTSCMLSYVVAHRSYPRVGYSCEERSGQCGGISFELALLFCSHLYSLTSDHNEMYARLRRSQPFACCLVALVVVLLSLASTPLILLGARCMSRPRGQARWSAFRAQRARIGGRAN